MLAARMPWARTCICCREMEVVGPAGIEAEVNAVGLMTDSRVSTAQQATQPYKHTHMHTHSSIHTYSNNILLPLLRKIN